MLAGPIVCFWLLLSAGSAVPPQAPALGVSGDKFTVDGQPRFLLLVSYFDALDANETALTEDFTNFAQHGIDGVRIFVNWLDCAGMNDCRRSSPRTLIDVSGALRPAQLARLHHVLELAASHRLLVDVTFTRDTVFEGDRRLDPESYERGILAVTRELKDKAPHVLFDLQNEVEIHGFGPNDDTAANIARIRPKIKEIDPARLVTVSTGSVDLIRGFAKTDAKADSHGNAALDAIAFHDPRVRDWWSRTARVVRELKASSSRPIYLQEPTAYQIEGARPGRDDTEIDHFRAALRDAREAGAAGWVFHTRKGFRLDERSFTAQQEPGEREFLQAH
jgi:hypothetical protein